MGWTKRQFITQAFDEIGLASYVFDLTADELESQLRRLDAMMTTWNGKGIRLGYPSPSSPSTSNMDDQTGVPDSANEAIYLNLAIRIAPSFGKQVSMETKQAAKAAYNVLLSRATLPNQMQFPGTMPSGAGNKPWELLDDPFLQNPVDPIAVGTDSILELN
jgi:hypothetical protein